MKKILCLLLCIFIITATVAPMTAYADPSGDIPSESQTDPEPQPEPEPEPEPEPQPPVVKTESQVTVGKTKINKQLSEAVKIEVTVTPATPARTVLLQRYSKDEDTYITQKTFTTSNSKTAKLQISIPKEMRKKTESFWRIYVPETDTAKSAVSKTVTVYTSNLKHIKLSSKACCIYCLDTKKVIYQKRMNKRLKPASCTKIMTLITAIETGKIHGKSSVTSSAVHVPAQRLHARVGDRYRNMDMAYAMILGSANDASIILAKGTAGSVSNFVRRMNKTAKKIGLKDSHFTNTYGVPNRTHYTTAYELSLMSAYGYKYDTYCKVVGRKMYGFRSLKYGKKYGCFTADRMVKNKVKGHIGGKTGFSEVLGASYSGLFKYKGRVYAVTIMHAKTKGIRWKDVRKLYKYVRKYGKSTY